MRLENLQENSQTDQLVLQSQHHQHHFYDIDIKQKTTIERLIYQCNAMYMYTCSKNPQLLL